MIPGGRGISYGHRYTTHGTEQRVGVIPVGYADGYRRVQGNRVLVHGQLVPVIGNVWDKYSKKLDTAYKAWGKTATYKYVTGLFRTYRPEVVVTHDVNGEYGHGAHRACADACRICVSYAADEAKWKDLGESWQVKKLYLHLYNENAMVMDWDAPMASFGGMTGFEAAEGMYAFHVSQHAAGQKNEKGVFEVFRVEPRDSACSCYRFGLAFSMVGEDVFKNDFFENIPE